MAAASAAAKGTAVLRLVRIRSARGRACVDVHNRAQQFERLGARALERIASDYRAESAARLDRTHFIEQAIVADFRAARKDNDTPPVERALNDVADPRAQRLERDLVRLVGLFRFRLLEMRAGQLNLDHV